MGSGEREEVLGSGESEELLASPDTPEVPDGVGSESNTVVGGMESDPADAEDVSAPSSPDSPSIQRISMDELLQFSSNPS